MDPKKKARQYILCNVTTNRQRTNPLQEEDLGGDNGNEASHAGGHGGGRTGDWADGRLGLASVVAAGGNGNTRAARATRAVVTGRDSGNGRAAGTAGAVVTSRAGGNRRAARAAGAVVAGGLGHGLHAGVGGHDDDGLLDGGESLRLLRAVRDIVVTGSGLVSLLGRDVSLDLGDGADGGVQSNGLSGDVAERAVDDGGSAAGDGLGGGGVDDAGGHGALGGGSVPASRGGDLGSGGRNSGRGGARSRLGRAAVGEDLTDPLVVGLAVHHVLVTELHVPQGDTTEAGALGVLADDVLEGLGGNEGGVVLLGGKTDIDLGVLALLGLGKELLPLVVVEASLLVVGVTGNEVAVGVVVELDEEGIKLGLTDHLVHVVRAIGAEKALGSTRDEVGGVEGAESVDEGDPGLVLEALLDINVETVDKRVAKGTDALPVGRRLAKGTRQELGKLNAVLLGADGVVVRFAPLATNAEEHLDALGLAVGDILGDEGAAA